MPCTRSAPPPIGELGTRTIFNLLGPLCNPANVKHYMLGVFAKDWTEPVAHALHALGAASDRRTRHPHNLQLAWSPLQSRKREALHAGRVRQGLDGAGGACPARARRRL